MIKYFDIFAGIDVFRSGLEKAGGFECVGYCEIDKYAKKAYETMYNSRLQEMTATAIPKQPMQTVLPNLLG